MGVSPTEYSVLETYTYTNILKGKTNMDTTLSNNDIQHHHYEVYNIGKVGS